MLRVGLPRGIKWCKSEGVICSELVKLAKVGLARGIK